MSADTQEAIANLLAQRLGCAPDEIKGTLTKSPLAAALALSLMNPQQRPACDPAATVRLVATIVGACPACLGEDPVCAECGGRGTPGWRDPDAPVLLAWITPPLRRLGLCVGRPRRGIRREQPEGWNDQ